MKAILILLLIIAAIQAFTISSITKNILNKALIPVESSPASRGLTTMMACRRNNKTEKRKRNREYARKFKSKTGGTRRTVVVEAKRLVVQQSEEKFQAEVFKMTTDDDMPVYTQFEFSS